MSEAQKRYSQVNAPKYLAENLSPELITSELHHYETRRKPEGLFRSAWNHVEYALNQSIQSKDDTRAYQFENASLLLGRVFHDESAGQDTILGSLILSTYLPVFAKRSHGEALVDVDCHEVYQSIGAAMAFLQPLKIDQPPQWRMAESAVLALSARAKRPDLLLYPTSPREESSATSELNHDSYFMDESSKIPIQQKITKSQKEYDDWITILTLQPLIDQSLKKSHYSPEDNLATKLNYLISLIVAETSGQSLSRNEQCFLRAISAGVTAHRWKAKTAA